MSAAKVESHFLLSYILLGVEGKDCSPLAPAIDFDRTESLFDSILHPPNENNRDLHNRAITGLQ